MKHFQLFSFVALLFFFNTSEIIPHRSLVSHFCNGALCKNEEQFLENQFFKTSVFSNSVFLDKSFIILGIDMTLLICEVSKKSNDQKSMFFIFFFLTFVLIFIHSSLDLYLFYFIGWDLQFLSIEGSEPPIFLWFKAIIEVSENIWFIWLLFFSVALLAFSTKTGNLIIQQDFFCDRREVGFLDDW